MRSNYAVRNVTVTNLALGGSVTYNGLSTSVPQVPNRPAPDTVHNIDAALANGAKLVFVSYPSNDVAYGPEM